MCCAGQYFRDLLNHLKLWVWVEFASPTNLGREVGSQLLMFRIWGFLASFGVGASSHEIMHDGGVGVRIRETFDDRSRAEWASGPSGQGAKVEAQEFLGQP